MPSPGPVRPTFRGITSTTKPLDADHLVKTKWQRLGDWLRIPSNASITMVALSISCYMLARVGAGIYVVPAAWMLLRFFMSQLETPPLKIPVQDNLIDIHELHPGNDRPLVGQGIFFLGNELISGKEIWLTNDDTRQHFLVMGTTGAGKTELLLAFAANALSWGSGLIFIDGKGDIKTMGTLYAMARLWGRDADFLLLNFMPAPSRNEMAPGEDISNTMNPYTTAEADDIKQQINGMMAASSGDGMWKDRAMSMLEAVLMALCWGRDTGLLDMSLSALRNYITLENIASFLTDERFKTMPDSLKENIRLYLLTLGNWDFNKGAKEQDPECSKQHGYLNMQLEPPLAALANQYGAIFDADFGEVDIFDVVLNRRLMIALLPSLAKSSDDTQRMGKIVVGALKSMMGKTLGNLGYVSDPTVLSLMKVRLTASPSPVIAILDEVGYYTVSGLAVIAAQARSLGFSMVYASQDLKAMTRYDEKEAQSIIANTNTKVVMRTEDNETMKMAVESGGKAARVRARSYTIQEGSEGVFSSAQWTPDLQKSVEFENRIDELDLKAQRTGEFTVIHQEMIVRGKGLYTDVLSAYDDPDMIPLAPNQFLIIRKPDIGTYEGQQALPHVIAMLTDASIYDRMKVADDRIAAEPDEVAVTGAVNDVWKQTANGQKKGLRDASVVLIGGVAWRLNEAMGVSNEVLRDVRRKSDQSRPQDAEFEDASLGWEARQTPAAGVTARPVPPRAAATQAAGQRPAAPPRAPVGPSVDALMDHGVEVNGEGLRGGLADAADDSRVRHALAAIRSNIALAQEDGADPAVGAVAVSGAINAAMGLPDEDEAAAHWDRVAAEMGEHTGGDLDDAFAAMGGESDETDIAAARAAMDGPSVGWDDVDSFAGEFDDDDDAAQAGTADDGKGQGGSVAGTAAGGQAGGGGRAPQPPRAGQAGAAQRTATPRAGNPQVRPSSLAPSAGGGFGVDEFLKAIAPVEDDS